MACRSSSCHRAMGQVDIWRFSAAFHRKKHLIARSASRPGRDEAQDRGQNRSRRQRIFRRRDRAASCTTPRRVYWRDCRAPESDFLGNAAGLLFPIAWHEPFGLSMIEAMACGTPVIALRNGSVPEVVDDGITGFIVDDEATAARAAGEIHSAGPDTHPDYIRAAVHRAADGGRLYEDLSGSHVRLGLKPSAFPGDRGGGGGVPRIRNLFIKSLRLPFVGVGRS